MGIVDDIIQAEIEFPCDFTDVTRRPYGILHHNVNIPDSWDSNHSRLHGSPEDGLADAIADMEAFYRERHLVPRVYQGTSDHKETDRGLMPDSQAGGESHEGRVYE